jgi:hypothetical protein
MAGGGAQGEGPEFQKPQYHKKKTLQKLNISTRSYQPKCILFLSSKTQGNDHSMKKNLCLEVADYQL